MRALLIGLVAWAGLAGCSDVDLDGPYAALPIAGDFIVGVSAPVHVARDRYGIAHINAQTLADAAFVQGYVMAHDRLPQMDILRRFGAGTLAELFGGLDPTVIDTDLEMRMHRMKPLAAEAWAQLQASADPYDVEVVTLLQRFADGVNAYAGAISTDNVNGIWQLDPNLLASFDPARFAPWDPVDSLVLGRFQAFALSWSTPFELDATALYQGVRDQFGDAIARDVMTFQPVGLVATIPGFPNVEVDTGSRADGRAKPHAIAQPSIPRDVLSAARSFFARGVHTGAFGGFGPHAFMAPYAGSNNWAIPPERQVDGHAVLATDQHLQLPNPSIFYPTHLTIGGLDLDPIDMMGVTFPGIPGVILGTNGHVAWSGTVSEHDVNDIYAETITPCPQGSCVAFSGTEVPIETFTEEIGVGAFGTPTRDPVIATYERVPHHGPIIPTIDRVNHRLVPRTQGTALSVRYTGYEPTFEIRALWQLARAARTTEDAFIALQHFSYGSQNWTMIDNQGTIAWSTQAEIPERAAAAYTWNATTNPTGLAPFFVLPGDGSAEWTGQMSSRYVPHATLVPGGDRPVPLLVTANADPVGATFDNDPLNGPTVDGRPLYVGVTYAAGLRQERIAERLGELGDRATVAQMEDLQHDTLSTMGRKMTPYLLAALDKLGTGAGPADFLAYQATLTVPELAQLQTARTLLSQWTFATSIDSAATPVFNAWMHFFIEGTLADEIAAAMPTEFTVWRLDDNFLARIVYALVSAPQRFVQGASGEPALCDDVASASADSCTTQMTRALLAAMTHLASADGFGTAEVARWTWGALHTLRIEPLFPNAALSLPPVGEPPFARAGDNFVVNRADPGWADLDFSQSADGPAQRFIAEARGDAGPIHVRWALPGGVIYDSRSPHYRDLLDTYYLPEKHFDAPFTTDEIVAAGESRWVFR